MNQRVRLVGVEGVAGDADISMTEAAEQVVKRVAALRPSVMMVVWQLPGSEIEMCSLPGSEALCRGMVCDAYAKLFPQHAADLLR